MRKTLQFAGAVIIAALFAACSPKLAGTWSIQKFETTTPGEQGISLSNIGTITFSKNGSGEKDIRYSALGTTVEDNLPFSWTMTDNLVTIESEGSEFAKTWIIVQNKSKLQQWKSTDGTNKVQILELIR